MACETLTRRLKHMGNVPALPSIVSSLCEALNVNPGKADLEKITRTVSHDESLAAQCLRMANSALYGQRGEVATVRDAVVNLGLWRVRDLAFSCSLPLVFANMNCVVPKECFWRHALATAVVAQELAMDFGEPNSEQSYLAGLLHDIGILINALLFPENFRDAMREAIEKHSPVAPVEQRILGFTHADSGRIVAELWKLPVEVSEVIEFHHRPEEQKTRNELTVIVRAANQLCWKSGMGYGYPLPYYEDVSLEDTWQILGQKFPKASGLSGEKVASLVESHLHAAQELAGQIFGPISVPERVETFFRGERC